MDFLNKFDKQQVQKITLIVIAALTVLALVLLLVIIIASVNPANPFGLADGFSDLKEIKVTEKDLQTGSLVLADDDHSYDYTFSGDELVTIGAYRNENLKTDEEGKSIGKYYMNNQSQMKLTEEAMEAAHNMLVAAESEVKKEDLLIAFTYGYNEADNEEYNTALLIYLTNYEGGTLDKKYQNWLDQHATEYGFIESFDDGYRYVGVAHAKAISDSKDINSLADYIEYLKENTSVDKTIEIEVDGATYKSYYVSCKEGDTIKVPKDAEYTISGTNEGGVVVTVKVK